MWNVGHILTLGLFLSYNSHLQNQARLKVLKKREDLIRNVLEEARQKLAEVPQDADLYQKVLQRLIAQSIFRLFEKEVVLRCREKDLGMVEASLDSVKKEFFAVAKRDVNIVIDKDNFLPPSV